MDKEIREDIQGFYTYLKEATIPAGLAVGNLPVPLTKALADITAAYEIGSKEEQEARSDLDSAHYSAIAAGRAEQEAENKLKAAQQEIQLTKEIVRTTGKARQQAQDMLSMLVFNPNIPAQFFAVG